LRVFVGMIDNVPYGLSANSQSFAVIIHHTWFVHRLYVNRHAIMTHIRG
jgi:hypothetical protein